MRHVLKTRTGLLRGSLMVCLFSVLAACSAGAGDDGSDGDYSDYFEGETVTLTVGYGVGGYDDYARMLAPYLEEELGAASVEVENQEGAGGNVQVNNIATAGPDGLTIGLINTVGAAGSQITSQEGVRFDLTEFGWIGRLAWEPSVVVVAADGNIDTFGDLMAEETPAFGSEGPGGANYLNPSVFSVVFDEMSNLEIVTGFEAPEIEAAITRGEIHAMTGNWDSRLALIEAGEHKPILVVGDEPIDHPAFEGVPTITDVEGLDSDGETILEAHFAFDQLSRSVAGPPGMEEGLLGYMRDALQRAANNEDLAAEAEERNRPISFLPGDRLQGMLDDLVNDSPEAYVDVLEESMG